MPQFKAFGVAVLSVLSLADIAAAQDRIIVSNGPAVTISPKKVATSLPTEKATYLGIATSAVSPAIREQLKLQRGIGVVVERVEKDSPAEKAGVQRYDIVEKFGDQLLVDGKQLAILVRINNPGDSVPLTVIRQGQRQAIKVTLSEKMVPVIGETAIFVSSPNDVFEKGAMTYITESNSDVTTDINNVVRSIKGRSSSVSFVSGETYSFRKEDGQTHLRISDKEQGVLFDGPVNTPDEIDAIPAEFKGKATSMIVKAQALLSGPPGSR